jgi:EAL domain-containing protein (putative c-di-GMP-specific phosphodiesterase class I)
MPIINAVEKTMYRYLVIDDVATSDIVRRILHDDQREYTLDITDDMEVALGYATKAGQQPDIIICALAVLKATSMVFLRHLAEAQFTGGIILINSKEPRILRIAVDLAEAHHLNVLGSLQKPLVASALLTMISRFTGLKEMSLPLSASFVTPEALQMAIMRDEIVPFFQPKMSIKTGEIIGVEALARWQHPGRGLLLPAMFISVAEEHGLIGTLTQEILRKTLQHAAAWFKADVILPFAVNLSGLLLSDVDLPSRIDSELAEADVDPSNLTLEITESGLCEDKTSGIEILLSLHLKGIHLSIDDFGTGHSTSEQLHKMPFSELKIDRQFVTGAAQDEEEHAFFQSAIMLAKNLKLSTVAEGVETQDDWNVCAQLGCDIAQGYLVGHAVPGETFLDAPHQPTRRATRHS